MAKKLRTCAAVALFLVLASLASVYSYGRFAENARGAPSHALPADRIETPIDRALAPLTAARPGQSGLALLADNLDAFAARALTARAAGRSLDLQYYIWRRDFTGNLLVHELLRAADRGVRVRLLLDDLNAHHADSVLVALDRHPQIEVRLFNPSRARERSLQRGAEMLLRMLSLNRRMHNKAWIADGRIAIVGGRNIGDEYFGAAADTNFLDADLAAVGPAADETVAIFDAFWNCRSALPLRELMPGEDDALALLRHEVEIDYASLRAHPYVQRLSGSSGVRALLRGDNLRWTHEAHVYSDPPEKAEGGRSDRWLVDALLPAMAGARRELRLISPYFVPGDAGAAWLVGLRERGVSVEVLTNSLAATDVAAVHGGYAPYRVPLLRGGVVLYELKPRGERDDGLFGSSDASLHTKAFMVDDELGYVGSFNLDPRSINLNTEMGIVFRDAPLTRDLQRTYEAKIAPDSSYRVMLRDGEVRWLDAAAEPPRLWTREPETGLARRTIARVVAWLPMESQL